MLMPFAEGFGTGCGLIVAIGAQNAFVLSQGVKRRHHLTIALICSLCDAILIAAGVAGLSALLASSVTLTAVATWGGAGFLIWYGLQSFCSAMRGGSALEARNGHGETLKSAVVFTLAVTLLNPHVYLDTVVLLGGVSMKFDGMARYQFGAGAMLASFVWFFGISLGGRAMAPVLGRPSVWRLFELVIALIMWSIAFSLIRHGLGH